jgi:nucleoside-diphosphate-sugar epimerase
VLRVIGRGSEDARLFGSYSIDSSVSRRQIGWVPPFSLSYGLSQTALWWKSLAADEDVLTAANKP